MSIIPDPATTYWVPMAGGTDLIYKGGYASGVTYNDGDIVIGDDGIAYLCVQDGTLNSPPVPWQGAVASVGYGTSLPANPVHGQEYVLVDNVNNPSYMWRFRYNGYSTSAYKWEFIGGTPWYASYIPSASLGSLSSWGGVGLALSGAPRAGEYEAAYACRLYFGVTNTLHYGVYVGAVTNIQPPYSSAYSPTGYYLSAAGRTIFPATVGQSIGCCGNQGAGAGQNYWEQQSISLLPRRVS